MSRFCEHCGAQLNDGAKFCPECGKRLNYGGWLYETFLRRDGRLNRWEFFKRNYFFSTLIGAFIAVLIAIVFSLSITSSENAVIIALLAMIAVISYLEYGLIIRRCHDLKENSLLHWCIAKDDTAIAKFLILIQLLTGVLTIFEFDEHMINLLGIPNFILGLYLLLAPGENGMNRYDTVD